MPISGSRLDFEQPAKQRGLFSPACAACGKDNLRTVSGKHTSANAGYCSSCGLFMCFDCAGKAGWLDLKRTCPECGKRLKGNTMLFLLFWESAFFLVIANALFSFGLEWKICSNLIIIPLFVISLWVLLSRYSSHRKRVGDFGLEASAQSLKTVEGVKALETSTPPARHREPIVRESEGGSTVEELERQFRADK